MGEVISKLEKVISDVQKDLVPLQESREEFLARCACKRISDNSRKYDEEFDKYLNLLQNNEINYNDLGRLAQSLESLSKMISSAYDSLSKSIELFQKNIFE